MARIHLSAPHIAGRERSLVDEVFESNYVAPAGEMLDRFEADLSRYTGVAHCVALSSGTAALHLALLNLGLNSGDEIWTSSMTFMGGVSPITFVNARPVFFDLDPDRWTLDPSLLNEELRKAATENRLPKAIVPTDLYGQACDLSAINALAAEYGIPVICDSAEALGALVHGQHAGRGAKAMVLSFNGNKIITSSGGGALLSDDAAFVARARYLSTQARQPVPHYEHTEIGYNYRLSNVSAAIGVGQLEQIEDKVARRRAIFSRYQTELGDLAGLSFMPEPAGLRSTRWLTCLTINQSEAGFASVHVGKRLEAEDIESRPLWKPMHMQPVFSGSRMVGGAVSEGLFANGLCLPSGSGMTDDEQTRVISTVKSCWQ